jgi:hypothetical protein
MGFADDVDALYDDILHAGVQRASPPAFEAGQHQEQQG